MKTNAEFAELTPDQKVEYFTRLSAEEVGSLTKIQKQEYDAWKAASDNAGGSSATPETDVMSKMAAEGKRFFAEQKESYTEQKVYVTTNLKVFEGTLKGKNALTNYLSTPEGKEQSHIEVNRA